MLDAIGHIALIVKDPSKTATLFKDLFGAQIVLRKDDDGHDETYVRLGRTWLSWYRQKWIEPVVVIT
jgi:hypothetical protein